MTQTIARLLNPSTTEQNDLVPGDLIGGRSLEYLCKHRLAVQDMIRALEEYQRTREALPAGSVIFNASRTSRTSRR
jgi:hypothetical protein